MRILIYGINFSPEPTGAGKYTGELAAWLSARGHEVRVVTAPPYYPHWRVGQGYSGWRYRKEKLQVTSDKWQVVKGGLPVVEAEDCQPSPQPGGRGGSLVVYRCPLWVPARPTGLKRIAHLASFALSSLPVMLAQTAWRPHVLLVIAPTLLVAPGAILAARLSGAKGWLHIQDFEVDAAFELGILTQGRIRKSALAAERWMLQRFDRVSTISRRMMDRLNDKRVLPERTVLFPNWVDCREIHPLLHPSPYLAELGLPAGTVVAMYSGAMGEKQGFEAVAEAAERLRAHPRLLFVFAGAGSGRETFHAATHHLPNVRWLPLQPAERLNDWLNLADIHLLPQRADAEDLMLPSKLIGMLACGRPIVAMARDGTQIASELKGCGVVVKPGSAEALARVLERLAADRELRVTLGAQARELAVTCFDREIVLDRFEKSLMELVSSRSEA